MRRETTCLKCGKSNFNLSRITDSQILATCTNCEESYLLDAVDDSANNPTKLVFWSPTEEKRMAEEESFEVPEVKNQKSEKRIEEKSVEQWTEEIVEFVKKESLVDLPFSVIWRLFWSSKGLSLIIFSDSPEVVLKLYKIENMVRERMHYFGEISPNQLEKERKLLDSMKNKIILRARKENKSKLTETDLELYLMETGEALPRRLLRMLHSLVNSELRN